MQPEIYISIIVFLLLTTLLLSFALKNKKSKVKNISAILTENLKSSPLELVITETDGNIKHTNVSFQNLLTENGLLQVSNINELFTIPKSVFRQTNSVITGDTFTSSIQTPIVKIGEAKRIVEIIQLDKSEKAYILYSPPNLEQKAESIVITTFLNTFPFAAFLTNENFEVLLLNDSIKKFFAKTDILDILSTGDNIAGRLDRLKSLPKDNFQGEFILIFNCKNNTQEKVPFHVVKLSDSAFLFWNSTTSNLDEINKKLKFSDEKYLRIFNHSNLGIYRTTPDGEIIEVNNALVNMLGFSSQDELKKINLKDYPYHFTDERIKFKEVMAENGIVKNRYTIWKTKNGDLLHIRENSVEVTDPFTGKIYYEGSVEDITDRLVSNEKLLEESVKFEQLFENNPLGVLLIDPASKIVKANNFFLNLINQPADFFKIKEHKFKDIPGFNTDNLNKFVNDVLHGETLKIEEIIPQNKEPEKVFIVYGVPIKITEGISGAYLIVLDISGIRAFEKELLEAKVKAEEMSKLKSSFLANMNHELRTPMNGILGFATLLKEELAHDALKKEMAERILLSGMRLLETLDSIIDLSKLEASNYTLEMRELDLNWSLAEVVALFYDSAKLKSLELVLDLPTDPVMCVADDRIFKKIIKNLLSNAIKFTFTGQVTISLRRILHDNSNYAEIIIKDTGIGIESNKKEVIFEAFRQGSEGLSRMFEGSGVGLTVTKRLVELLNGKLIFESEPGSGSSFSVLFPYFDELKTKVPKTELEEISVNSIEKEPVKRIQHSKKRIIYVEDDSVNRDLVAYFLSGKYELDFASDGTSGLIKLNLKDYDLVLMDIHLGNGPSGEHVLKSIREDYKTAKLPVIALTAYVMPGNKQRYLSLGFTDYIPKPFKRELLVETVDRHINAK